MPEFCTTPKNCMAVAYGRESGEEPNDAGIDAAYAEIMNSVHKELEAFVTKYCPKKLNEFDDLMEQAFWQYHRLSSSTINDGESGRFGRPFA